jgi:hypothetical protein
LNTSFALIGLRVGQASDEEITRAMIGSLKSPQLIRNREEQGRFWRKTHNSAAVAVLHLKSCMVMFTHQELAASPLWHECVRQSEPEALMLVYRKAGGTRRDAADAVARQYSGLRSSAAMSEAVEAVYMSPTDGDARAARERAVLSCLRSGK